MIDHGKDDDKCRTTFDPIYENELKERERGKRCLTENIFAFDGRDNSSLDVLEEFLVDENV